MPNKEFNKLEPESGNAESPRQGKVLLKLESVDGLVDVDDCPKPRSAEADPTRLADG
jgi:hypothetical protein